MKKIQCILIVGKGPTQGLDYHLLIPNAECPINFSEKGNKFCLHLHYNGRNSYLFVNGLKIYQFKEKDFELNAYPLCLGNISKYFTVNNIKKLDYMHICMIFRIL